jgi:hypothetical protein
LLAPSATPADGLRSPEGDHGSEGRRQVGS